MSSGKSVASILLAILADQGKFTYNDKVMTHWPEFGINNKDNIKI